MAETYATTTIIFHVPHTAQEQCIHADDVAHLHQQQHQQQQQQHVAAADVAAHQPSPTPADMAQEQQGAASKSNSSTIPLPQAKLTLLKRPSGPSGKLCQAKLQFKRVKTAAA
ncbi:unnamed protein product [Closterium sp. Yama58-4]|nr:unnamed protein product [Closterium sp. Yama58-4]